MFGFFVMGFTLALFVLCLARSCRSKWFQLLWLKSLQSFWRAWRRRYRCIAACSRKGKNRVCVRCHVSREKTFPYIRPSQSLLGWDGFATKKVPPDTWHLTQNLRVRFSIRQNDDCVHLREIFRKPTIRKPLCANWNHWCRSKTAVWAFRNLALQIESEENVWKKYHFSALPAHSFQLLLSPESRETSEAF